MRLYVASAVLCMSISLAACGSKELSRSKASDLISDTERLKAYWHCKAPIGNVWWDWRMVDDSNPEYPLKTLQDVGLITLRESGQKEGYWTREYIIELTPKGKDASNSWVRVEGKMPGNSVANSRCWTTFGHGEPCHETHGIVYDINLAQRKMLGVTGITADAGGKESIAEFEWKWSITPNGKTFGNQVGVTTDVHKGRASFRLYDDGWRIAGMDL
jgi:hypothetical protein